MKYLLRVLTSPLCWLRCEATNTDLDAAINKLLDAGADITSNEYTTRLGPLILWTENFPYAYGGDYTIKGGGLPTRRTVFRLYDAIAAVSITERLSRKMEGYK